MGRAQQGQRAAVAGDRGRRGRRGPPLELSAQTAAHTHHAQACKGRNRAQGRQPPGSCATFASRPPPHLSAHRGQLMLQRRAGGCSPRRSAGGRSGSVVVLGRVGGQHSRSPQKPPASTQTAAAHTCKGCKGCAQGLQPPGSTAAAHTCKGCKGRKGRKGCKGCKGCTHLQGLQGLRTGPTNSGKQRDFCWPITHQIALLAL